MFVVHGLLHKQRRCCLEGSGICLYSYGRTVDKLKSISSSPGTCIVAILSARCAEIWVCTPWLSSLPLPGCHWKKARKCKQKRSHGQSHLFRHWRWLPSSTKVSVLSWKKLELSLQFSLFNNFWGTRLERWIFLNKQQYHLILDDAEAWNYQLE